MRFRGDSRLEGWLVSKAEGSDLEGTLDTSALCFVISSDSFLGCIHRHVPTAGDFMALSFSSMGYRGRRKVRMLRR